MDSTTSATTSVTNRPVDHASASSDGSHARGRGEAAFPPAPLYGSVRSLNTDVLRLRFLGRVSDKDLQDPASSLVRQLHNALAPFAPGSYVLVGHNWDIESGRKSYEDRGASAPHEQYNVPIPRDGGLKELLALATGPNCDFDAVVCESMGRVARRHYPGAKIEHDLEQAGVVILPGDEPIPARKRATAILTRRVKQATDEWYVLNLLEQSWDGFCVHAEAGWNIGVPPYGFRAERVPHPAPAKRAEGLSKSRLVLEPEEACVVEQMYVWRVVHRLSYQAITDRLNAEPLRYPPPRPVGERRHRGSWSTRTVRDILLNPKYTGHMVWNRRARNTAHGRPNPREQWVISPEPTHAAIITWEMYEASVALGEAQERTRAGSDPNSHPATKRTYVLRSYVCCDICGRRLSYVMRKGKTTYGYCQPSKNNGRDGHLKWPGHPKSFWIAERRILDGILGFFASAVFNQQALEATVAEDAPSAADAEWQRQIDDLERTLLDLDTRRQRLVLAIEQTDDPDGTLVADIVRRSNQLAEDRRDAQQRLHELRASPPETAVEDSRDLLAELGEVSIDDLAAVPEAQLRRLFDVFGLNVRINPTTRIATCTVTISEDRLPLLRAALETGDDEHAAVPGSPSALCAARDLNPEPAD